MVCIGVVDKSLYHSCFIGEVGTEGVHAALQLSMHGKWQHVNAYDTVSSLIIAGGDTQYHRKLSESMILSAGGFEVLCGGSRRGLLAAYPSGLGRAR
jgi:hypothetical protein